MLQNEYLVAKIGVDTAENEPLKVWRKIQFIFHSPPYYQGVAVDLTSPPNADAPEHAAFPPAFPPAPDAGGGTVVDSPLVVRE